MSYTYKKLDKEQYPICLKDYEKLWVSLGDGFCRVDYAFLDVNKDVHIVFLNCETTHSLNWYANHHQLYTREQWEPTAGKVYGFCDDGPHTAEAMGTTVAIYLGPSSVTYPYDTNKGVFTYCFRIYPDKLGK